jgi:MYXO-CTERM domain-containing protein
MMTTAGMSAPVAVRAKADSGCGCAVPGSSSRTSRTGITLALLFAAIALRSWRRLVSS